MHKLLTIISLLTCALALKAETTFPVTATSFEIMSNRLEEKMSLALKNPEGILKRFKPAGADITNKQVSSSNMSFTATKTVLLITQSVNVFIQLDINQDQQVCAKNEVGYKITLNFDGSDQIITDNMDRLDASLCLKYKSSSALTGVVTPTIVKGPNYSMATGKIARNIIELQVDPLIAALKEEIKNSR